MVSGGHLTGRVFNNFGFDILLFGQGVACQYQPPRESLRDYRRKVRSYEAVAAAALPAAEALEVLVKRQPAALTQHAQDRTGWVAQFAEGMY